MPQESHDTKPTPSEVNKTVERILHSNIFARKSRSRQLLSFFADALNRDSQSLSTDYIQMLFSDVSRESSTHGPSHIKQIVRDTRELLEEYYRDNPEELVRLQIPLGTSKSGYVLRASYQPPSLHMVAAIRRVMQERNFSENYLASVSGVDEPVMHRFLRGETFLPRIARSHLVRLLDLEDEDHWPREIVHHKHDTQSIRRPARALHTEPDFEIAFDPKFEPSDVKQILTALSDYYRKCGGAGFRLDFESQEALVTEPVHA